MEKKNCFVIMPFGGKYDDYYRNIYKPTIEKCGLISRRADDIYKSSPIINDIWNYVLSSDIIIADLSDKNPNVMYELGLAHAIAKPVILLSNSIDSVPFDLKYMRILLYESVNSNWSNKLKENLEKFIIETLQSPMETILPTFINIKPNEDKSITEFEKDILDIKQSLTQLLGKGSAENKLGFRSISNLSGEEYSESVKDAYNMYFQQGLDLAQIKEFISNKYRINILYAEDIMNAAIRRK